jgi:hypothetical protein
MYDRIIHFFLHARELDELGFNWMRLPYNACIIYLFTHIYCHMDAYLNMLAVFILHLVSYLFVNHVS